MRRSLRAMRQKERQRGTAVAAVGTAALHAVVVFVLFGSTGIVRKPPPPVMSVNLVAAPAPTPEQKKAPEAVQRQAAPEEAPPPKATPKRRTSQAKEAPPPPPNPQEKREPAPRTTPKVTPAPGEKPSTGSDVATVKTSGVEFQYPEYLRNLVSQIYRRWQRPSGNVALRAEVFFLVHRDGSISDLQFVQRSGNFAFDLEAEGAIEAAGNAGAFGPLPDGYQNDVLPVSFFFNPQSGP